MYAIAKLIQTLHVFDGVFQRLGLNSSWIFDFAILISAIVVLIYTFLGGYRAPSTTRCCNFS